MCPEISILRHVIVIGWSNNFCKSCPWIFRLIFLRGEFLDWLEDIYPREWIRSYMDPVRGWHAVKSTVLRTVVKLSPHTNLNSWHEEDEPQVVQAPRRVPIESSPHPWIQWLTPIEMDNCSCLANRTTTGKLHVKEQSHWTVWWLHIAGSIVKGDG
jgi:hypothetical protein